jgi:hypothetical protein
MGRFGALAPLDDINVLTWNRCINDAKRPTDVHPWTAPYVTGNR